MGFRNWLNRLLAQPDSPDTVPFYDFNVKFVAHIPRSELNPGAIEVQIQGMEGLVWVLPEQLQPQPVKHAPFDDDIRDYLRQIQTAFAEHRDLTLEDWEDGFRRDANPKREIAVWLHAANVYVQFAADEPSKDRRTNIYRCILACMATGPDAVWSVLKPQVLERATANRVVNCFYGKDT